MRVFTLGDYFKERYNSTKMGLTYSLIGAVGMMALIAVGFNAMARTIEAIIPKEVVKYSAVEQAEYTKAYQAERIAAMNINATLDVLSYEELAEREKLQIMAPEMRSEAENARLAYLDSMRPAKTISYISKEMLVWIVSVVVLLYAILGGVMAAFIVDLIQGVFIIILSFLMLPFAWAKINSVYGGSGVLNAMSIIHQKLPQAFFQIFGAPQTPDFTWYYIITLSFMAAITVVVQPTGAVLAGSAKDEFANRSGVVIGNFIKRFCTVLWALLGLAAIVLYSGKVVHSDLIWGHAALDLLGSFNIGLIGLMIACLLAALLSTVDCHMLTSSALLMHNFYTPLAPNRSQKHYIWAGRILGAAVILSSGWVALQFDTILQILKFIWEINVMLAPAYWLGIKWRRANRIGAWSSIGIGALLFLVIPAFAPTIWPNMRYDKDLLRTTNPAPRTKVEHATEYDVRKQQDQIAQWDKLNLIGQTKGERPAAMAVGQEFEQTYTFPKRSIFWAQGLKADTDGQLSGRGMFSTELWIIEKLGVDLQSKPYALNETLRILFRTLLPFAIMIVISLITRPDPTEVLNRFYAKMRTKVIPVPEIDAREVELSLQDPHRHDNLLVFPKSQFEIYKWTRQDFIGFALSVMGVGIVLAFLWVLVRLGA
jgi:SSS family solute:Na+ symporter